MMLISFPLLTLMKFERQSVCIVLNLKSLAFRYTSGVTRRVVTINSINRTITQQQQLISK